MGATPFQPISWSDNEPIYVDKMNAMANNDQWLFENAPNMYYNVAGVKKTTGIKIMTGFVAIPITTSYTDRDSEATFYFGSFFSQGCQPVVVASLQTYPQTRIIISTRGIGTFWPDSRGFEVRAAANDSNIKIQIIHPNVWVAFVAIGW